MAELSPRVAIWHPPNPEIAEMMKRLALERFPEYKHIYMVDQYFDGESDIRAHPAEAAMVLMGQERIANEYRKHGIDVTVVSADREAVTPVAEDAGPLPVSQEELERQRKRFEESVGMDSEEEAEEKSDGDKEEIAPEPETDAVPSLIPSIREKRQATVFPEPEIEEETIDLDTARQIMEQTAPTVVEIVKALISVPFLCAMLGIEFERARMRKTVLQAITAQIEIAWKQDKSRWLKIRE